MSNTNPKPRDEAAFKQAADYVCTLPAHVGKRLDQIATTDEGLKYLDWVRGQTWVGKIDGGMLLYHLEIYLDDPTIALELRRLIGYA